MSSTRIADFYQITITNLKDSSASYIFENLVLDDDSTRSCTYIDDNGNLFMLLHYWSNDAKFSQEYAVQYDDESLSLIKDVLTGNYELLAIFGYVKQFGVPESLVSQYEQRIMAMGLNPTDGLVETLYAKEWYQNSWRQVYNVHEGCALLFKIISKYRKTCPS